MLQDQVVNITFGSGVDTKTNEKLVLPTKLTNLENGIFSEKNTIKKRPGYDQLSQSILGGSSITDAQAIFSFEDELLLANNPNVYSYNETNENWVTRGKIYSFNATSYPIVRNAYQQSRVTQSLLGNILISAWVDTRGGVRYTVKDFQSKLEIVSDTQISASGNNPKLIGVGEYIFLFYHEAGNLYARQWSVLTGSAWSSTLTVGTDFDNSNPYYDVDIFGNNLAIAYRTTTPNIAVKLIKSDLTIGNGLNGLASPVNITATVSTTLNITVSQSTNQVAVFWHNSASGMQYAVRNFDLTSKLGVTVFDAAITSPVSNHIAAYETSAGSYAVLYDIFAATNSNRFIKKQTVNDAGTVGTAAVLIRSVSLASEIFTVNSVNYFLATFDSTLQATYFIMRVDDGLITNKFSSGVGGGTVENNMLSRVDVVGSKAYLPSQVKTKIISDNGTTFFLKGVQYTEVDFDATNNYYREKLGQNLHLSGGYLSMYDGQSVVEHGFHLYPEGTSAVTSKPGGSIGDGTYLYYITYEWVDNRGQVHRSKPSVPLTVTQSATGGAGITTLTIPTLRLTSKISPRTNVHIGVYRTTANGTIAYRVSSVSSFTFNDTTADTITYIDTQADASITSNDFLYTTGGVIPSGSTQSAKFIKSHKNRLFLAGLENPLLISFSKKHVQTEGVIFPDEYTIKVEDDGGAITAMESMDDYLVIFKQNRIYVLSGDGPNALGLQNDYQTPVKLSSDIGCDQPSSIVLTPIGIMFKSLKGIYLINRQLQVSYVGADVEGYNDQTVVSADVIEQENLVLFLTNSGKTLAFDYYLQQWGTYTNHEGLDATIWQNSYLYLRPNGVVFNRNRSSFTDASQKYSLLIETAWLKLQGIQGFQRVKRALVLGNYYSSHILKMSVAYDYRDYYFNSYLFNPDSVILGADYGDGSPYGSDPVYGSTQDGVYQFDAHMRNQKCQSIKFKFEDLFTGAAGEGYSISDLSLRVGIKRGMNKLGATKKVGS